ncbi:hypothetical protein C5167_024139, partial [Papaver somniferum]
MSNLGEEVVRVISKCMIKPHQISEEAHKEINLTPWDLTMLSAHAIQKGLLFAKPPPSSDHEDGVMVKIIDQLKNSLSLTLSHFYPLSGRLSTKKQDGYSCSYKVFIDCSNSQGAEFIHAIAEYVTVVDILNPLDVPSVVRSFFALDGSINHDGHCEPLLVVQVTELVDGFFIDCSFNHVVGDGTSFWHFFSTWAEICKSTCRLLINDRSRLNPPLSMNYFGCSAGVVMGTTKAAELLSHGLGWAAWLLHEAVAGRTDDKVRKWLDN